MVLYLFGLSVSHIGDLGPLRYSIVAFSLVFILTLNPKLFISKSISYNVGGVVFLIASVLSSSLNPDLLTLSYVVFIFINFFIYPAFKKYPIPILYLQILVFYLLITFIPLGFKRSGITTIYHNPNNFATVVLCTSYFILLAFERKFVIQISLFLLAVGLMFLSNSRTQTACIVIFGLSYYGQKIFFKSNAKYLILLAIGVTTYLYIVLITDDTLGLLETIQSNTSSHKSSRGLSYRDVLLFASLDILSNHPLGVGMGQSGKYIKEIFGENLSPHNTYMKIAVEGGWLMLTGYIFTTIAIIIKSNSVLCNSFLLVVIIRGFFESSTPFTLSLISGMLIIPFFLNENTVSYPKKKKAIYINPVKY